jgi:hypothetical protein
LIVLFLPHYRQRLTAVGATRTLEHPDGIQRKLCNSLHFQILQTHIKFCPVLLHSKDIPADPCFFSHTRRRPCPCLVQPAAVFREFLRPHNSCHLGNRPCRASCRRLCERLAVRLFVFTLLRFFIRIMFIVIVRNDLIRPELEIKSRFALGRGQAAAYVAASVQRPLTSACLAATINDVVAGFPIRTSAPVVRFCDLLPKMRYLRASPLASECEFNSRHPPVRRGFSSAKKLDEP